MPAEIPDQLPVLRAAARRPEHFDTQVEALRTGLADGAIRKVHLDDAKTSLSRAVERAWDIHVREPFFHAGRFEDQPEAVRDLDMAISITSLHSVLSAKKKLDRSGLDGPVIEAMTRVLDEAHPLAEAAAELKPLIVKGRAPRQDTAPAEPANPNQVRGSCACCFRDIAVGQAGEGKMAHHGYQRPGSGEQTASCPGTNFRPLEKSTEGLQWLIGVVTEDLARTRERRDGADDLTVIRWSEKRRGRDTLMEVHRDEPGFDRRLRQYKDQLDSKARIMGKHLEELGTALEAWAAYHASLEPAAPAADDGPEPG